MNDVTSQMAAQTTDIKRADGTLTGEQAPTFPNTKAVADNPSLTKIFDDMEHGDLVDALDGLRIEAAMAIDTGDMAVQKWARSVGVLATVMHKALTGDTSILPPSPPSPTPEVGGLTPPNVAPGSQAGQNS